MNTLQETWSFLAQPFNWPFLGAIVACLMLSALQFVGLDGDHDAEADAGLDLDADLDVEADLDLDADTDLDWETDLDADANADADLDADASFELGTAFLRLLGVGQAPLTMVLLILLAFFGLAGLVLNGVLWRLLDSYPRPALVGVVPVAFVVASLGTGRAAGLLGRLVPPLDTTATGLAQLVGCTGRVTSPRVDDRYGQVRVRDRGGTQITVFAVTRTDDTPILRDSQVLLLHFDPNRRLFIVVPPFPQSNEKRNR
jgi:membrane protein implicated in regulation of membrane protease activity